MICTETREDLVGTRFTVGDVAYTVGDALDDGCWRAFHERSRLSLHVLRRLELADDDPAAWPPGRLAIASLPGFALEPSTGEPLEAPTSETRRWYKLARALVWVGDAFAASFCLGRVLALNPYHTEAIALRARLSAAQGDIDGACDLATQAIAIEPHWAQYRFTFIDHAARLGRLGAALSAFEEVQRIFPRDRFFHVAAAALYLEAGRPHRAKSVLQQIEGSFESRASLDDDVEQDLARHQCAGEKVAQARIILDVDPASALVALQEAHDCHPRHLPAAINLGLALVRAGRAGEALSILAEVMPLVPEPHEPQHLASLACAAIGAGQDDDALRALALLYHDVVSLPPFGGGFLERMSPPDLPNLASWWAEDGPVRGSAEELARLLRELLARVGEEPKQGLREAQRLAVLYEDAARLERRRQVPRQEGAAPGDWETVPTPEGWERGAEFIPGYEVASPPLDSEASMFVVWHRASGNFFHLQRVRTVESDERRGLWNQLRIWMDVPPHPNLVQCHFFRVRNDEVLLFFPPMGNETLQDAVESGSLYVDRAWERVALVANQLACALHALHARDVVHGNLFSEWVRIDGSGTARLAGFRKVRRPSEEARIQSWLAEIVGSHESPLLRGALEDVARRMLPTAGLSDDVESDAVRWDPVGGTSHPPAQADDMRLWGLLLLGMLAGRAHWESDAEVQAALSHEDGLRVREAGPLLEVARRCLAPDGHPIPSPAEAAWMLREAWRITRTSRCLIEPPETPAGDAPLAGDGDGDENPAWAHSAFLELGYQVAGMQPLADHLLMPSPGRTTSARVLADLSILELAARLIREQLPSQPDLALPLACLLRRTAFAMRGAGDAAEALRIHVEAEQLLAEWDTTGEFTARHFAGLLAERSRLLLGLGDLQGAVEHAERALSTVRRLSRGSQADQEQEAQALLVLAQVRAEADEDPTAALEAIEQAIPTLVALECLEGLPAARLMRARLLMRASLGEAALEEVDRITRLLDGARALSGEVPGDGPASLHERVLLARAYWLRHRLLQEKGEVHDAWQALMRAFALFQELVIALGSQALRPEFVEVLEAMATLQAHDPEEALPAYGGARALLEMELATSESPHVTRRLASVCVREGRACLELGQWARARTLAEEALALSLPFPGETDSPTGLVCKAEACLLLGTALVAQGSPFQGLRWHERAEDILAGLDEAGDSGEHTVLKAFARIESGTALRHLKQLGPARDAYRQALSLVRPLGDDAQAVNTSELALQHLVATLRDLGDFRGAANACLGCLGLLAKQNESGWKGDAFEARVLETRLTLGHCLMRLGEQEAGAGQVDRTLALLEERVLGRGRLDSAFTLYQGRLWMARHHEKGGDPARAAESLAGGLEVLRRLADGGHDTTAPAARLSAELERLESPQAGLDPEQVFQGAAQRLHLAIETIMDGHSSLAMLEEIEAIEVVLRGLCAPSGSRVAPASEPGNPAGPAPGDNAAPASEAGELAPSAPADGAEQAADRGGPAHPTCSDEAWEQALDMAIRLKAVLLLAMGQEVESIHAFLETMRRTRRHKEDPASAGATIAAACVLAAIPAFLADKHLDSLAGLDTVEARLQRQHGPLTPETFLPLEALRHCLRAEAGLLEPSPTPASAGASPGSGCPHSLERA